MAVVRSESTNFHRAERVLEEAGWKAPETVVILFAKAPAVGTVKTRMQPPLSDRECLIPHNPLLRHALTKLGSLNKAGVTKVLYLTGNLADARRHSLDLALTQMLRLEPSLAEISESAW